MEGESRGMANLPWAQGLVLALLLGVGSLFVADVPYVSDRRVDPAPRADQRFDDQDVEARLWQDPLGVVQRARETERAPAQAAKRAASAATHLHDVACLQAKIAANAAGGAGANAIVLAVMLRGGPYSEFVEQRRRTRYAVLAALGEVGYAPVDSDHLGWIERPQVEAAGLLPEAIPYEWFDLAPDAMRKTPATPVLNHVLVLWLDDRAFTKAPVERMSALVQALTPQEGAGSASAWRIIGPTRSDGLLAMVDEARHATPRDDYRRLHYYAASPTVSDETLQNLPETGGPSGRLGQQLASGLGIGFTRTIATDAQLVRALVDELDLRGLVSARLPSEAKAYRELCRSAEPRERGSTSHIAVIAEWDTLYGRSLRRLFRPNDAFAGFCVDSFSYMRGLDGMRPDEGSAGDAHDEAKPDKGDPGNADRRKDGTFIERAEGQSQFDYLRRLAKQMHERDQALQRSSADGRGLEAIGVLGNDVHDKMLVLQALQPEFPTAIFFTTDLDARLLHPREQAWARNLIVASSFGLRLDDRLQEGTPPFRDVYQTSEFFAARLAIDDARRALPGARPRDLASSAPREATAAWRQEDVAEWLGAPRIFEIGRTRAFDFTGRDAGAPPPDLSRVASAAAQASEPRPAKASRCRGERWLDCGDIHPPGSDRAPDLDIWARWLICLVVLLLWVPVFSTWHGGGLGALPGHFRLRDLPAPQRNLRLACYLLLALLQVVVAPLALARAWPAVADWMTAQGKPLAFTEGISTWPTEFIRLFAFLLGGYLLLRGWRGLARNQDAIAEAFFLTGPRDEIVRSQERAEPRLTAWTRLVNMFRLGAVAPSGLATRHATGLSPGVQELWQAHVVQNRLVARLVRSIAFGVLAMALSEILMLALHEHRVVPQRGELALQVHERLHQLVMLMLYLVVAFSADATLLCVKFMRHLRGPTCVWPRDTVHHFEKELAFVDDGLVKRWIDLQFVAARTLEVNRLVYYPFILLSLILLSRSPAFDDWQMPMAGKVLAVLGAVAACLCAAALRGAAERARTEALKQIDEALLRANGRDGCAQERATKASRCRPTPRQIELLRDYAANLSTGAFAKWSQQPILKALLLPFATVGGSTLLDYLSLANL